METQRRSLVSIPLQRPEKRTLPVGLLRQMKPTISQAYIRAYEQRFGAGDEQVLEAIETYIFRAPLYIKLPPGVSMDDVGRMRRDWEPLWYLRAALREQTHWLLRHWARWWGEDRERYYAILAGWLTMNDDDDDDDSTLRQALRPYQRKWPSIIQTFWQQRKDSVWENRQDIELLAKSFQNTERTGRRIVREMQQTDPASWQRIRQEISDMLQQQQQQQQQQDSSGKQEDNDEDDLPTPLHTDTATASRHEQSFRNAMQTWL